MKPLFATLSVIALLASSPSFSAENAATDTKPAAVEATAPAATAATVDPKFMEQWNAMSPEQKRAFFMQMRQQHGGKGGGRHAGRGDCGGKPDGTPTGATGEAAPTTDGAAAKPCGPGGRHGGHHGGMGGMGQMDPEAMKAHIASMTPEKRAEMKARIQERIKQMQEMEKALGGM